MAIKDQHIKTKRLFRPALLPLVLLVCAVLASCAGRPRPKGQSLYPAEHNEKGYSSVGRDNLFEDEDIRVYIRHLKKGETDAGPLLEKLIDGGYIVFRLTIQSKSRVRVMYNTAYTVLTSDEYDYRKPLDFTDLYDITDDYTALAPLKGRFYDLNTTVTPGEKVSKLLIFKSLDDKAETAGVVIKDLYIGTKTRDLSFPFVFRGEGTD